MSAFIGITVLVLFIGVLIGKSTSALNNGYYDVVINDGFAQGDIGRAIQDFCLVDEYIHDYISYYDEEQATAVTQLKGGIEQISAVVQTNSATSEQSASASEELSGQAQMLKQIIGNFKLKDVSSSIEPVIIPEMNEYDPSQEYNFDSYDDKY